MDNASWQISCKKKAERRGGLSLRPNSFFAPNSGSALSESVFSAAAAVAAARASHTKAAVAGQLTFSSRGDFSLSLSHSHFCFSPLLDTSLDLSIFDLVRPHRYFSASSLSPSTQPLLLLLHLFNSSVRFLLFFSGPPLLQSSFPVVAPSPFCSRRLYITSRSRLHFSSAFVSSPCLLSFVAESLDPLFPPFFFLLDQDNRSRIICKQHQPLK